MFNLMRLINNNRQLINDLMFGLTFQEFNCLFNYFINQQKLSRPLGHFRTLGNTPHTDKPGPMRTSKSHKHTNEEFPNAL